MWAMSRQAWLVFGGLGCGALLLVLVMCGGGGFMAYQAFSATSAEVSADIDALLTAARGDDFPATYETETTPEFQKACSKAEYQRIGEAIARLGALKSKTSKGFNVMHKNGKTTADVNYQAQFEQGPAAIAAKMQKLDGQWKVVALNVTSSVFMQDIATLTCPKCKGVFSPGAKFCPHCGEAVEAQGKAVEKMPEDDSP
jgi:hypothetical protein